MFKNDIFDRTCESMSSSKILSLVVRVHERTLAGHLLGELATTLNDNIAQLVNFVFIQNLGEIILEMFRFKIDTTC